MVVAFKGAPWCKKQSEDSEGIVQEGKTIKGRYIAEFSMFMKPLTELGMPEKAYQRGEGITRLSNTGRALLKEDHWY